MKKADAFTDRRKTADAAKALLLEKFKARTAEDDPILLAKAAERRAIAEARAERQAARALEAAAAQEAAEAAKAAEEADRKAARDARYAARKQRKQG